MRDRLESMSIGKVVIVSRSGLEERKNEKVINVPHEALSKEVWDEHGIGKIDIVIHLAAFTPKNHSQANDIEGIYQGNLCATRRLFDELPSPPEKIIFASTLDVYAPGDDERPINENSPLGPTGLYGASKLFCEQLTKTYASRFECPLAILRYGHIYGPGEGAYAKLIPHTIRTLLKNEAPVIFGDGSQLRDFLYVEDAVEATIRAAGLDESVTLNIVSGISRPIRQFVEEMMEVAGFDGEIQYREEAAKGRSLQFDASELIKALGNRELTSFRDGVRREIEYFREMT